MIQFDIKNKSRLKDLVYTQLSGLVLTLSLSGCILGNQSIPATTSVSNEPIDKISGFYITEPKSLSYSAELSLGNSPRIATAAPTNMPSEVSNTMTNPVLLVISNMKTGLADIGTFDGKFPISLLVQSDLSLAATWNTHAHTYWRDPLCKNYATYSVGGQLSQTTTRKAPLNFIKTISGEMQIQFRVLSRFRGNCTTTFQALSACYQDAAQCGGATGADNIQLQTHVLSVFQPWIQAGVFTASEISSLTQFGFEATYQ